MRKFPLPAVLAAAVLVILAGLLLGWSILKALPSRQLARFPKFVQHWVIPAPVSAVLPTVAAETDTSGLLQLAGRDVLPTVTPAAPPVNLPPTPTLVPSLPTRTPTPDAVALPAPAAEETAVETAVVLPPSARIAGITHVQQDWNNCGPATMAMALSFFGESYTQTNTAEYLKPNPEDRNVSPYQMAAYVNQRTLHRAIDRVNGNLDLLKQLLAANFPVILEIGLDPPGEVAWLEWYGHYLLAAGYDDATEALWVYDSLVWDAASLATQNSPNGRPYTYAELSVYWPQFNNTYIVLFPAEREQELAAILGADLDLVRMWERALETNRLKLLNQDDNAFLWFNLGTAYNSLGRHAEAAAAYDKARSIGLPWRMLWYQFGPYESYYHVGRYIDMILLADTTLQDRPYFEESFFWRGKAYEALGEREKARADFQAAARFNPYFTPAADALAALGQ